MDGRNQVIKFDGFEILFNHFAHLRSIPFILFKDGRIMDPRSYGLVNRQMHLHRLSVRICFPYTCFYA